MKERPIIFSGEMVRAILDGRKTQTRRVIKPQPHDSLVLGDTLKLWTYDPDKNPQIALAWRDLWTHPGMNLTGAAFFAYGQPGDRLWVRETWQLLMPCTVSFGPGEDDWDWDSEEADGIPTELPVVGTLCYKANDPNTCNWWRPSIYMPRWASRLTLEVVNVRVERVQEISEEDCCLETGAPVKWPGPGPEPYKRDMRTVFSDLWDSINAKRGYSWASNPWVWVIGFKRIVP